MHAVRLSDFKVSHFLVDASSYSKKSLLKSAVYKEANANKITPAIIPTLTDPTVSTIASMFPLLRLWVIGKLT